MAPTFRAVNTNQQLSHHAAEDPCGRACAWPARGGAAEAARDAAAGWPDASRGRAAAEAAGAAAGFPDPRAAAVCMTSLQ
jgi:hypothetical protein